MATGNVVYDSLSQFSSSSSTSSSSSSLSGRDVSHQFIAHFYKIFAQDVNSLYALYEDDSTVIRVDTDEEKNTEKPAWYTEKPKKGQVEIHEVSIALPVSKVHIKSFDVCESGNEFLLLVDGSLLFQQKTERTFSHAFLLAPLAGNQGYYIKNEILRFHAQAQPANHNAHAQPQAPVHAQHHHAHQQANPVQQQHAHAHTHTHLPAEDHATHTQSNALNHHDAATSENAEEHVEHTSQKAADVAEHLNVSSSQSSSHSFSSSPSKSPSKTKEKNSRRKRHEASQVEEQKHVEQESPTKVEESHAHIESAPLAPVTESAVPAAVTEPAAVIAAVVEEKHVAPVEPQAAAPAVVAHAPAATKEEKKPRSWAHIVNKNAPVAPASTQPAPPAPAAAPVKHAPISSTPSSSSAPSRPARESAGTIVVSGVPATAKTDDVKEFFSQHGTVVNTRSLTHGGKTSVYVTFASNSSADSVANQSTLDFFGVQVSVKRSSAPASAVGDVDGDDGFQQSQNRRHARAQERKHEKQAPAFARGGGRGGGRARGFSRGGRGGRGVGQAQSNGAQPAPAPAPATATAAATTSG